MNSENIIKEAVLEFEAKFTLQKALSVLLKHKNWKDIVRQALSDKKESKLTDTLLIAAVMFLSSLFHVSSADELINKIEQTSISQQVSDVAIKNKVDKLIVPVSKAELLVLNRDNPFTGKPFIGLPKFEKTLETKVKETINKINKDPVLQNIDHEKLVDIILESFKKSFNDPSNKDALTIVNNYLEKQNKDQTLVHQIVEDAVKALI
jgi:hypothetical protein